MTTPTERVAAGDVDARVAALRGHLERLASCVVAVSGGVDSLTLATLAHAALGPRAQMAHAVSPAVPAAATARVRALAARQGWRLTVLGAGEFDDPHYRGNPINRCYYCKRHLYAALAAALPGQLLSGANTDDLSDYRPGLDAAAEYGVIHPFVELGVDKAAVRAIARRLGLDDVAELPAAPCLSSRVETGIPIQADVLAFIDAAEGLLRARLGGGTIRCRWRRDGVVVELDPAMLRALDNDIDGAAVARELELLAAQHGRAAAIRFAPYVRGSAFVGRPA